MKHVCFIGDISLDFYRCTGPFVLILSQSLIILCPTQQHFKFYIQYYDLQRLHVNKALNMIQQEVNLL